MKEFDNQFEEFYNHYNQGQSGYQLQKRKQSVNRYSYNDPKSGLGNKIIKSIQSKQGLSDSLNPTDMQSFLRAIDQSSIILFNKIHRNLQSKKSQTKGIELQLRKQQDKLHSLLQAVKEQQSKYSDLKAKSSAMQKKLEQLNNACKGKCSKQQKGQSDQKLRISELSLALDEQISISNRQRAKVRELQNELQVQRIDIQMESERLQDQNMKLKQETTRKCESQIQQINQLKNKVSQLTHQLQQLRQVVNQKSTQNLHLNQQLRKCSQATKSHDQVVKSMSQQLENKQKQLNDMKSKIQKSSLQVNKKLKQAKQTYQQKIRQLQTQLSNHHEAKTLQLMHSQSLLTASSDSFHEYESTGNNNNDDEITIQKLKQELRQLKQKTQKNSFQVNRSFKQQKEKLHCELQSSIISNRSLQDELKRAYRRIEQLESGGVGDSEVIKGVGDIAN